VIDEDQAPVADAGGEQVIVLPAPLVTVNGNKSTDDRNIVSYLWTRDRTSPAAGVSSYSLVNVRRIIMHSVLAYVCQYCVFDVSSCGSECRKLSSTVAYKPLKEFYTCLCKAESSMDRVIHI